MIKQDKLDLVSFILLLLVFCSGVRLLSFFSAEMQPVFIIAMVFLVMLSAVVSLKLNKEELLFCTGLLILTPWIIWGFFEYGSDSIISFLTLMVGPSIVVFCSRFDLTGSLKTVFFLVCFLFLVLGLLQISLVLSDTYIEELFKSFISRFRFSTYPGGRGVGFLFSEPSHAARFIWLLFVFYVIISHMEKLSMLMHSCCLGMILLLGVMNASLTCVFLFFMTFFVYFAMKVLLRFDYKTLLLSSVVVCLLCAFLISSDRVTTSIEIWGSSDAFSTQLSSFGGVRFVSVLYTYFYVLMNPFGFGAGASLNELANIFSYFSITEDELWILSIRDGDASGLKPSSYLSQFFLDFGLLLLVPFIMIFIKWSRLFIHQEFFMLLAILWVSVFQIAFYSTTTMPVPWLSIGLILMICKKKDLFKGNSI
ncbi:hypothetical protein ACMXYX_02790 [Neptuniibacter sp. QD72_48]|uniref:hypothetical protein n=1 Tax=Neptuniibacter sp. QD72_48 TaxID=3398214 RepID=UPI0039F540B6